MPYSSGTYTPASPEYPAVAGTLIEAAKFNTIIQDLANALSVAWPRDGQAPATGNIPMGGYKFTGAGKAAARDQFATYEQLQDGEANFIAAANVAGTADAVTLQVSPAPTGYETAIDLFYVVELENTSEDVTHNLNSLGAKNTKKFYGGTKVKVAIGDLQVGMLAHLKYDGTDLVLMNPRGYAQATDVASAATIDLDTATGDLVDVTGTTTITAVTLRRGQPRTVRFTGALTLTHGASLVLPGAANITTAAGDFAVLRGYAGGVVRCVNYVRAAVAPLAANVAYKDVVNSFTKAQASTPVQLTDAATVAVDASLSNVFYVTLAGNRTLGQPSNPTDGQAITIFITQDATGSRTLAYHADWLFAGGVDPTLSTAASSVDCLSAIYRGTKWYAVMNKAFA